MAWRYCVCIVIAFLFQILVAARPTSNPADAGRMPQLLRKGEFRSAAEFGLPVSGTDNTARLQAAIHASAGKTLWLPDGVYRISPNSNRTLFLSIPSHTRVVGGSGAVLQVTAAAGPYDSILAVEDGTGVVIRGFTIDSNIADNPIGEAAEISSHARIEIKVLGGTGTVIEGMNFRNSSSENTIFANFSSGVIRNNVVTTNGTDPHAIPHDNSVIYLGFGSANTVTGNMLRASGNAAPAAVNAIEVHGSNHTVRGNLISNFANCIDVAGIDLVDDGGNVIENNTCGGALTGIRMTSLQYSTHTSGYGINGLLVSRNYIRINQTAYAGKTRGSDLFVDPAITYGIVFNSGNSLPVRNVRVLDNTMIWDQEGSIPRSTASIGAGVYANANQYANIEFAGNTLDNAPLTGIRFEAACEACRFHDNTIRNAASTGDGVAAAAVERTALFFYGLKLFHGLDVSHNIVVDDFSTTRLRNHIFAGAEAACSGVRFVGNTLTTSDGTHANLLGYISLVDSNVRPYLFATMSSGYFTGVTQPVNPGSRYLDYGANRLWTASGGGMWSTHF
jgi:hypothetical protein